MPELPEVETIAKGLRQTIAGKKVKEVQAIFPKIVKQKFNVFKKSEMECSPLGEPDEGSRGMGHEEEGSKERKLCLNYPK